MPNGFDKNYRRLVQTCAAYRERYGEWPAQARLHPLMLWDLAQTLSEEDFQRLGVHVELRTRDTMSVSVGGARGHLDYNDVGEELDHAAFDRAWSWLSLQPRRPPR